MEGDTEHLREALDRLFPRPAEEQGRATKGGSDWQKIASLMAVLQNFTVISGAPGTGKTATAAKAIILLLEQSRGRKLRIALAAPTGKAAARLQEVVALARDRWCPEQANQGGDARSGDDHPQASGQPASFIPFPSSPEQPFAFRCGRC